jgi:2-methylcitrate dehydratase PrpD
MEMDRRRVLAASSALVSASAATGAKADGATTASAPPKPDPDSGESRALAEFVARTRFEDLPAHVVEMTKRSILDAIGVSLGASGLEPACRPFVDMAIEAGGAPQATIIGFGKKVPVTLAAFANGSFGHALDYEDIHDPTGMHPNAPTVPAALAAAEAIGGVSGKELIVAVALGCDIVCRLQAAQRATAIPQAAADSGEGGAPYGFYPPAIVGTFGAATAAGKVLGLTADQMLDCWSLALCQNSTSGELIDSPRSEVRAVRDAFGTQSGVQAAFLAKKGVKGFDKPFEGRFGFFAMYARGNHAPGVLAANLGERFAGGDISYKAWPACRGSHLYVQAALDFMKETNAKVSDIAHVTASVGPVNQMLCEPAASKRAPSTAIDAKFSIPFCVATALVKRDVVLASFLPEGRADPEVLACAAKVGYRLDPAAARTTPQGGGTVLRIEMKDGTVHDLSVKAIYGSPALPMPDALFLAKFMDCGRHAAVARDAAALKAIAAQVLALDQLADVAAIARAV